MNKEIENEIKELRKQLGILMNTNVSPMHDGNFRVKIGNFLEQALTSIVSLAITKTKEEIREESIKLMKNYLKMAKLVNNGLWINEFELQLKHLTKLK